MNDETSALQHGRHGLRGTNREETCGEYVLGCAADIFGHASIRSGWRQQNVGVARDANITIGLVRSD